MYIANFTYLSSMSTMGSAGFLLIFAVIAIFKKEPIRDSKQDLKEEISRVAYEIYEQIGISGREVENWLEAERTVLERLSVREPFKAAKKLVTHRKRVERRRRMLNPRQS